MEFKQASELVDTLRNRFFDRLKRKTGWGREELKLEFERAVSDTFVASWDSTAKEIKQS